ncbi:hypothetical protein [Roseiterribacter gracilis]|uniref:Uncharacterized protein n=1 Tax=Roseiterribacter gracilis TaxID=2812848 RepID=A0A8S8XKM6_9PROT|nr:hypothetical protein TMPK1_39230 [Rhodospirillales bacterium TMPK1]
MSKILANTETGSSAAGLNSPKPRNYVEMRVRRRDGAIADLAPVLAPEEVTAQVVQPAPQAPRPASPQAKRNLRGMVLTSFSPLER